MSRTLNEPSPLESARDTKRGPYDSPVLDRVPMLVAARIAIEWARIDRNAGIRGWGSEHWGQTITIGSDVWAVGYRGVPGGTPVITVTLKGNEYGGGPKYQWTWPINPDDLMQGAAVPLGAGVREA